MKIDGAARVPRRAGLVDFKAREGLSPSPQERNPVVGNHLILAKVCFGGKPFLGL